MGNEVKEMREDNKRGILYREWKAASPKAVLLLVHGLGAHSSRWEFLSNFFLRHNISSYAIELKGYGKAQASKSHPASFKTYFRDIHHLYDIIKEENRSAEIFLVGESVGALISLRFAADNPGLLRGLISISPAIKSALKFTLLDYFNVFSPLLYNPGKLNALPFDYAVCTRDVDYLKMIKEEKREIPQAASRLLFDIVIEQMRCGILKQKIMCPVLFLIAGKDTLMVPEASKAFFKILKSEDKTLREYPDMYHSISIDMGREKVFQDILKWVEDRI